jgi:hypothetical protein
MRECSFAKGLRGLGLLREERIATSNPTRGYDGPSFEKKVARLPRKTGVAETPTLKRPS